MAIIRFQGRRDYLCASRVLDARARSVLQAKGSKSTDSGIFFLSDDLLLELDDTGVKYTEIREDELSDVLTDKAYELFLHWKTNKPEVIYFNEELPPFGFRRVDFYVEMAKKGRAREVFERFEAEVKEERDTHIADLAAGADLSKRVYFSVFVSGSRLSDLLRELADARITAYSRESTAHVHDDADRV